MTMLIVFAYLQVLDLMTTVAFLASGTAEANPVVHQFMKLTASPLAGLVLAKALCVALGVLAWRSGKAGALQKANVFFACLVLWNMYAVVAGALGLKV
jgi:hypothetical protein